MTITTCPNPREIVGYLPAVKPTWFFAVPRIWEKLRGAMLGGVFTHGSTSRRRSRRRDRARSSSSRPARRSPRTSPRRRPRATRSSPGCAAMLGLDEAVAVNAGAAPTPREVIVFFHAIGIPLARAVGHVGDLRRRHGQPARQDQDRDGRPARRGRRDPARRRRRGADALRGRDGGLPQPARQDRRDDRLRRLAAHGRHRRDRRGRLPQDRRPQEGDHHQRGRQEHVAGEHRGDASSLRRR